MQIRFAWSILVVSWAVSLACGRSKPVGLGEGAAGTGAAAGTGGAANRSDGCGQVPPQGLARFVKHDEVIPNVPAAYAATYTNRIYYVRIPMTYDPDRAYPTILLGPGCGASGDAPIPIHTVTKEDAIVVGMNGVDNCFTHETADSPELPYFDETLKNVEASFCVDKSRVFVAGFSSGSWLTSYLGCTRAGVIKAQASVAGGLPPVPACNGPIPAMYVSDKDDLKNTTATVMMALERVRATNGCGNDTEPYDIGVPSPCVQYKGCMPGYPLVWCLTAGIGHADESQTQISTVGFWHFWQSLP
jgi:hypothetical protein